MERIPRRCAIDVESFVEENRPLVVSDAIASGWFHDVHPVLDSISITWNCVHGGNFAAFEREVANPEDTLDRDMLAYLRNERAQTGSKR